MGWVDSARNWFRQRPAPRIGLALGGGFARGIAHVGVLRVFEREGIPIHCISGVSAGSIVAAAFASGATPAEIEAVARSMSFKDVARWTLNRMGLAGSERMNAFLSRLLKQTRFENMRIPLAVVASDICRGEPVIFKDRGDVILPIRASCSYPGLFLPIRHEGRCLVDGMVSMDIPAAPLRHMGATHIISVALPNPPGFDGGNMLSVVNRCFQVMSNRTEREWRRYSDLVLQPDAAGIAWNGFISSAKLIESGERAALAALPAIRHWLPSAPGPARIPTPVAQAVRL